MVMIHVNIASFPPVQEDTTTKLTRPNREIFKSTYKHWGRTDRTEKRRKGIICPIRRMDDQIDEIMRNYYIYL